MTAKELKEAMKDVPDEYEVRVYAETALEHRESRTIYVVKQEMGEVYLEI